MRIRGAGSKDFYGGMLSGEVLDVAGYRGIVAYEPTELYITAQCGTPLAEIEAALAEKGQMLACEPPAFCRGATVGGCVAAGLSGPRRQQAGAVRDFVLGREAGRWHGAGAQFRRSGDEERRRLRRVAPAGRQPGHARACWPR